MNQAYRDSNPGTMLIGVQFQEPGIQEFNSRNQEYRGSIQGTMLIEVHFQEPGIQEFNSRNQAYRGSLPGTRYIGVQFQQPCLQWFNSRNQSYRGSIPGTSSLSRTQIGLVFVNHHGFIVYASSVDNIEGFNENICVYYNYKLEMVFIYCCKKWMNSQEYSLFYY